jgi:hypothetical protein
MPNYNENNTRDNSIEQLPRMIFQLPNTETGNASPTITPVFFCQSGCSIEYHFSNITSCQFNNDGKKFTITPTDTTNINYIMWNGTDVNSGEKMTQFTLKEIYFTAPAKDYIGTNSDILSQSIQYYFVFVNEKYSNLMICVSVIGSVNNLGNAPKSNGFVMLETLSTRIPSVNVQSQLNNLNNFNLGTLIPPNKPFFNTLITNNIQYIIITEVVDVPVNFFSNMATMVNGGTQLYTAKMNQFKTNIPVNSPTTVLFYNENSQLLDNQSLVCNSNCDLVPGKKITPTIGTYTTTTSDKKPETKTTISGTEVPPEQCETEEVWANQSLGNNGKDASPTDSTGPDAEPVDNTFIVAITVSLMIIIVIGTGYGFYKTNHNIISIILTVIGMISIIVGFSVGCGLFSKTTNYWISYLVGLLVWIISLSLLYKYRNYGSYSYNSSLYPNIGLQNMKNLGKQQPYRGINIPPNGFNEPKSWFGKIFSKSNKPQTENYSQRLTVPSEPKQLFFDKILKRSPQTDSASIQSIQQTSSLVPQASSSPAGISSSASSLVPQASSSPAGIGSKASSSSIINASDFLKSKNKAINLFQQKLNSSKNQSEKNKITKIISKLRNNKITKKTFNEIVNELK